MRSHFLSRRPNQTVIIIQPFFPLPSRDSLFSFHLLLGNLASLLQQMSKDLPLPPQHIVLVTGAISTVLCYGGEEPSKPSTDMPSTTMPSTAMGSTTMPSTAMGSTTMPSTAMPSSNVVLVAPPPSTVLGDVLRISWPLKMRRTAMLRRFVMLSITRMAMMRRTAMLRRFVMLSITRMAMACWWASFLPSYSLHSFRQDLSHDFSFPPLGVTEHKA